MLASSVTPTDNSDAAYTHVQFNANPISTAGRLAPGEWIYAAMFVEQLAGDQLGTARIVFKLQQEEKYSFRVLEDFGPHLAISRIRSEPPGKAGGSKPTPS